MGIDYSASLAYGYRVDDSIFENSVWELDELIIEYRDKITENISFASFGDGYSGEEFLVLGLDGWVHSLDVRYDFEQIELGEPPSDAGDRLREVFRIIGLPVPTEEPKWWFGGHIS